MTRKRETEESIVQALSGYVSDLLHILVMVYVSAILLVLPLYFTNGYGKIGTDKADFFRWLIEKMQWLVLPILFVYIVLVGILVVKQYKCFQADFYGIVKQYVKEKLSVTDWFAILFFASLILSYHFSRYKEVAKWGSAGWFMGLFPNLAVLASYFLVSRFFRNGRWVLYLSMLVSFGVFILGILNRFEIRPIKMAYSSPYFLSTIGNINWYCGYQVLVFFIGPTVLWMGHYKNMVQKCCLIFYSLVGFMSLILQGSDSGIVALFFFFCILFYISCKNETELEKFWQICVIFFSACTFLKIVRAIYPERISYTTEFIDLLTSTDLSVWLLILFLLLWVGTGVLKKKILLQPVVFQRIRISFLILVILGGIGCILLIALKTRNPQSFPYLPEKFFVMTDTWGSNRGTTWKAGWMCFEDMKPYQRIVGVGPDCMYSFISRTPNNPIVEYCKRIFGEARLTNAHNEWLTILVNQGILGLIGFVGMMVSAMVRFLKRRKECPWAFACGICLFTHTINCMFSFQQTLNLTVMFVILGVGEACYRNEINVRIQDELKRRHDE